MNRVIDDLIASAKSLADKAGKATDKAVEYSKLKYQSVQLAGELRDLYGKLGNAVYTMVKSDFDNKDLMDSIISEIDHVKETLEQLEGKLAEFRNSVICPACGAVNDKDACYCNKCGNKFAPKAEEAPCCCEKAEEKKDCTCTEESCCCDSGASAEESASCCEGGKKEEGCCGCSEEDKAE